MTGQWSGGEGGGMIRSTGSPPVVLPSKAVQVCLLGGCGYSAALEAVSEASRTRWTMRLSYLSGELSVLIDSSDLAVPLRD